MPCGAIAIWSSTTSGAHLSSSFQEGAAARRDGGRWTEHHKFINPSEFDVNRRSPGFWLYNHLYGSIYIYIYTLLYTVYEYVYIYIYIILYILYIIYNIFIYIHLSFIVYMASWGVVVMSFDSDTHQVVSDHSDHSQRLSDQARTCWSRACQNVKSWRFFSQSREDDTQCWQHHAIPKNCSKEESAVNLHI